MKLLQEKLAVRRSSKAMAAGIYPYFRMIESDQDTEVMISGKKSDDVWLKCLFRID